MKTSYVATLVFSLAALAAGQTMAMSSTHLTRDQVRAELEQAQRTGDIQVGWSEQDRKLNEIYPNNYPAKVVAQGNTRAQVQAELNEAIRTGDIWVAGDN